MNAGIFSAAVKILTKRTENIETMEQAKMLKKDLPLHIKGMDLIAENPLDTLISNNTG